MTAAPAGTGAGTARVPVRQGLLTAVLGVVLVAGAVTQTAWWVRDLGTGALAARAALVLAAALGGALLALGLRDALARPAAAPAVPQPPVPLPVPQPVVAAPQPDDGLVRRVLEVRDLLDNTALRARLDDGIRSAGFELITPAPGEPFDPGVHTAVDTEAATDGAAPGTIAAVEQVGLLQQGRLYRRAAVVVWEEAR
ncbi:GrpE protein [Geodermatophilus pulveris]|uniref:GrpE protein n=1 Tax=Geodermatophilus pulveris TaxID=1564159 RepID=A0A239GJI5_9ACTN|nr:nucleotide exchange factor GrpE [Geodermatophilus pulveris]SNS68938.1 GrpE protein [Geodermatophilus pulveris]